MAAEFFERQNSKDCSVHSLNNSLGRVVITPEEVTAEMERRVGAYALALGLPPDSKEVKKYRNGLAENDTFFSAECAWYASAALGRSKVPKQLNYRGSVTPEILSHRNLIFLGKVEDGSYHAVGARDGKVYDSLNIDVAPEPLTDDTIKDIYKEVMGVFAL